ncbi:MAG: hypothetical protein KAS23_15660 [Anaerohalosphaera sp.]|nr:hypothetical protein [Anaerohalosphaera sp.]
MPKNTKLMLAACVMLSIVSGISFAGSKIDGWIIDDFESYSSTDELKASNPATDFGVKPWWILQEIQAGLGLITIPAGNNLSIKLVSDPNAFLANGEVDPDGGQGLEIHYDLTSGFSCDLFMLSSNMGIPFSLIPTGQSAPLDYLPIADFTKLDKITLKVKRASGNTSNTDSFGFTPIGPDLLGIVTINATPVEGTRIMEYPADTWETIEFDINGESSPGTSTFGLNMVAGFVIGTYDGGNTNVTYVVDDIMVYKESVPCQAHSPGDINLDCEVNMLDLAVLAAEWLVL